MKPRFAVMGHPIEHSLSPQIHQQFAAQTGINLIYEKIDVGSDVFEQQVKIFFDEGGMGLNITLPYKQRAFAMAADVTPRAAHVKAANTLWMKDGQLCADNTDGVGFLRDIQRYVTITNKAILLLGAGGAARGVLGALFDVDPKLVALANRTLEKAKQLQQDFPKIQICDWHDLCNHVQQQSYDVVINATSASLAQDGLGLPKPCFASQPFCYDLAYQKQGLTPFVSWVRSQGCEAIDGIGMLIEQAAEAFFIWHGVIPDRNSILL